ncbi:calcium-binding protein CML42-like [Impatiens glandulifera]|uniref:calcium-binding protein CML42-like n=1 Tax=Impatiens glandulifera TaxID=253017 RepID=UPI001FB17DA7|nr:calcium-binding protein CML42-like [Impatiens glandulifera]
MESTTTTDQCQKQSLNGSKEKLPTSFSLQSSSLNTLRLRRIFDFFDKNDDGMITIDELSQALRRLSYEADMIELSSIVNAHIRPGNYGLEFSDFEAFHRSLNDTFFDDEDNQVDFQEPEDEEAQEESDLKEAFKVFDENGDGFISANELQAVLGKLGFSEGSEIGHCKQMIVSVDRNNDGRVDFIEFKDMMHKTLLKNKS